MLEKVLLVSEKKKPTTAQIIQAVIDVLLAVGTALIALFK